MSKLFSHPINPPPLYTQTSSGSNATSTHTSATVTPTIARSVPVFSPCEDEYLEEPEVDAWCSVCDRLIKPVKVHEAEDKKLDANGIPKFIKPVPARLPTKKAKRNPSHPGLKRSNTLTKLATAAPKPTIITEPIRPSPPIPSTSAPPKYNTEIYCSVVCSDLDKIRSGQQIDELGREMEGLNWGQGRDDLPSPLWMGSSASEGDDSQSGGEKSAKSVGADEVASPEPVSGMNYDFGYFDMVFNGVENGLRERERRRSSQSNGQKSGLPSLMTKRNSSGYGYGYNQTVSSSDSLSSLWSVSGSDGRVFSEDSSSSLYGGYGLHGRGFRGLTPLRPSTSNQSPVMNNTATLSPNSRRPSMASNRSFSFSRPSAGSPQPPPMVRQNSGVASSSMMKQAASKEGECGSAPVSSLFHSYAAAFHRTPSSAELCRPVHMSPPLKPYGLDSRPRSRRSSQIEYEAINMGRRSSGSEMGAPRSRHSFTPVSTGILAASIPSTDYTSSTPTQRLIVDNEVCLNTRVGSLTSSMARSSSRESSRSRPDVDAPIFEEDEVQPQRHERKSSRSKSSGPSPLPRTGSFACQDKPSTAITIGDQIFAQSPPPSRVTFDRSISPRVTKHLSLDRRNAGQVVPEENASTPLARPRSTQGVNFQEKEIVQAPFTPVSSSLSKSFTAEIHKNFSWNDLAAAGKVTTYQLPDAAMRKKGDNSRLFYFG